MEKNNVTADRSHDMFLELLRSREEEGKLNHDKMQTEFINITCHEMKTPIQSILTYSELLHNEPEKNVQEYITAIFRNAVRLQRLSNNILDLARIQSQTLRLQKERFDINELILSVVDDFKNQIEISNYRLQNVKLIFEPKRWVFVKADKDKITQVLSNLISNAFKFTMRGDISITVKEEREDSMILVTVKDTGSGIDNKIIPKLFTKFTTTSFRGTGLGLFISKNIIEAHGGKMFAMNNADGVGSSFTFTLPITPRKNILSLDR